MTNALFEAIRTMRYEDDFGIHNEPHEQPYVYHFGTPLESIDEITEFFDGVTVRVRRGVRVHVRPYYTPVPSWDCAVADPLQYVLLFRDRPWRWRAVRVECVEPIFKGLHYADITYLEPTRFDPAIGKWYAELKSFTSYHLMKPGFYPYSVALPSRLVVP